jgi:hypothetical protein
MSRLVLIILGLLFMAPAAWAQQAMLYCRQADSGAFVPVQPGQPCPVTLVPSSSSAVAIASVVSTSAEASHIIKAAAGNLYSAYAVNLTSTPGYLLVFDAASAPVDGAVTPLDCAPLPASGSASVNYRSGPPKRFATGVVVVVSSAATCFTKTTGTITAFISGDVQ